MNEVKVSVVMPVYNVEKYVETALMSILNQTLREIEIIIVNDGSVDSSLEVVKKNLGDSRIKVVSTGNNGLSIARNLGLYMSKGEYVYFFDSDDVLESATLERCYIKSKKEDLDLLFFDADIFSDEGDEFGFDYLRASKYEDKVHLGLDILEEQLQTEGFRSSACLLFLRRQYLVDENLFFFPRILHEDELFTFLAYLKAKKVGLINETFFHRRVRNGSIMTQSVSFRNIYGYLTVCRELKSYLRRCDVKFKEKRILKKRLNLLVTAILRKSRKVDGKKNITTIVRSEFFFILDLKNKLRALFPFLMD